MNYIKEYENWLNKVSDNEKDELILIKNNENAIKESFSMPLEFGTAGMRGIISMGIGRMNNYTVARATQGVANYIISLGQQAIERGVLISYDTRKFSLEFALVTAKVLSFNKIKSYLFEDVRPVPICSYAIRHLNCVAGVMITASHNPKEYNGYKLYGDDGAQMAIEGTAKVVEFIESIIDYFSIKQDIISVGEIKNKDNFKINDFITVIGESLDKDYFAQISKLCLSSDAVKEMGAKIKIIYTPIHGAGYKPVTRILDILNIPCTVVEEQKEPDINFSTVIMPNPEQPDALRLGIELAKKMHSDLVIGTDPDCDRMGIAIRDSQNKFFLLNGNQIGAMLMEYILMRHTELNSMPKNPAVIKTIVTTKMADNIAIAYGAKCFDVLTGFKFIGELIKKWESTNEHTFMFGYEESFGYLSGTHARDKDAVVASMLFAEMTCYYASKGLKLYQVLDNMFDKYGYYADVSKSLAFSGLDGMQKMSNIMEKLRCMTINNVAGFAVEKFDDFKTSISTLRNGEKSIIELPKTNVLKYHLANNQWVCVRPSGTEPKLKIYCQAVADSAGKAKENNNNLLGFMEMLVNSIN